MQWGVGSRGFVLLPVEDRIKHWRVYAFFRLERYIMNLFSVTFGCVVLPALRCPIASRTSGCW